MFEHDYSASNNLVLAIGNKRASDAWERAYNEQNAVLQTWMNSHVTLEQRVASLEATLKAKELKLFIAAARIAGLNAQLAAMKAAAPHCSAMAPSGQTFSDGESRTMARIAFDKAFDTSLSGNGVKNPSEYRE